MLRVDDVSFAYGGSRVVHGVSFDVAAGALLGLIGPNGSGKTTLLRLLAGTRRPSSGRVLLDGVASTAWNRAAVARRMAVVPQQSHVAFDYTVLEVVLMGRYPHLGAFGVEGPRDIAIAHSALESTGVLSFAPRLFSTLSGGEQQRVVIAAALAQLAPATAETQAPPVLLLDEPTAALDLKHQLAVAALLQSLHAQRNLTVVVSTHDLSFAASVCSDLVLLKEGRVLAAGPTDSVLNRVNIRRLYDVDAEVLRVSGRRTAIVPLTPSAHGDAGA